MMEILVVMTATISITPRRAVSRSPCLIGPDRPGPIGEAVEGDRSGKGHPLAGRPGRASAGTHRFAALRW